MDTITSCAPPAPLSDLIAISIRHGAAVCRLLALPAELRNSIWQFMVDDDAAIEIGVRGGPAMLAVCKQIRKETQLMYDAKACFCYLDQGPITSDYQDTPLYRWLASTKANKGYIKRLILRTSDALPPGSRVLCGESKASHWRWQKRGSQVLCGESKASHWRWQKRGSHFIEAALNIAERASERIYKTIASVGVHIDVLTIAYPDPASFGYGRFWADAVFSEAAHLKLDRRLIGRISIVEMALEEVDA